MSRLALAWIPAVLCLAIQAQDSVEARLLVAEKVMDRFYRGERLERAVDRSNEQIRTYNVSALAKQAELEKKRLVLEGLLAPIEAARIRLKALDDELRHFTGSESQETVKRKVDARNALLRQISVQNAKVRETTEAYNALARQTQQVLDQIRNQATKSQTEINTRLEAFTTFSKSGEDVAFFHDLNKLLVETRQGLREMPGNQTLQARLDRVRKIRRELATWTLVTHSQKNNGLVIVETKLLDEPCWFIVDTGAMDTIVNADLMEAIGHGASLNKVSSLSVVGGMRVLGLSCRIPSLTVADQTLLEVTASAVPSFDVGIDGLLGQSFLKVHRAPISWTTRRG